MSEELGFLLLNLTTSNTFQGCSLGHQYPFVLLRDIFNRYILTFAVNLIDSMELIFSRELIHLGVGTLTGFNRF